MIAHSENAVEAALARIIADDATLQAWAHVDMDAAAQTPESGPLSGEPFGVKDIIDVMKMPTAYGLREERRTARFDAWCVAALRAAGAVPIGKTRTTTHAWRDPAPTVNPLDPSRTPGGSSAGSAAAVAAWHVAFALGTQTIGSVLRPAAYCGVVGFKPTWGRVPLHGVAPLAPSLDHAGIIARDVTTATRVAHVLLPSLRAEGQSTAKPCVALAASVYDARFARETHAAVRRAVEHLGARGITIVKHPLPAAVAAVRAETAVIVPYEARASLRPLLGEALPPELRALLQQGEGISRDAYERALARREVARAELEETLGAYDAFIVPGADAAPARESTGDGSPFAPWSYFGTPAVSIPIPGTPPAAVSLQMVSARGCDARLLAVAAIAEAALR
ncbi:MAG: amidase family protein [Candidatus Velthaea sp.]